MPLTKDSPVTVGVAEEVEGRRPHAATDAAGPARASVMLLRLLRAAQPISRAELARRLGVNRSTVTDTFKPLIAAGVVREEAVQLPRQDGARALGRPAVALSFDDGQDYFAGVNVGVRHSTVGLATINGEVLAEEEFDTPSEPGDALRRVVSVVERLRGRARGRKLRMVGVSVPGPTDATRRRVVYAPHLGWDDVDLAGALCFGEDGAECGTES